MVLTNSTQKVYVYNRLMFNIGICLDNNAEEAGCIKSVTRVNGKAACQNEVVFEDNFDRLSPKNWSHIIQIAMKPVSTHGIYE